MRIEVQCVLEGDVEGRDIVIKRRGGMWVARLDGESEGGYRIQLDVEEGQEIVAQPPRVDVQRSE